MKKNGFALIPLAPRKADKDGFLLPDRRLSLWPYTDLSDKRLKYGDCFLAIKQSPDAEKPLKVGAMANPSWAAYCTDGLVFVKSFTEENKTYPDFGCSVEVYTNPKFLELETLGPLETVPPSGSIKHTEIWNIFETKETKPAKLVKIINYFLAKKIIVK
ncbi:MAG: hypothetical protein ABIK20_07180 [Candidatus Omnitrophota bacterium]|nr:hypothetical protein [Candidatus Omnitrophota bacterium]